MSAGIPPHSNPMCQQKEESTFRVMLQAFLNSCSKTKTPTDKVYMRTGIGADQRRVTVVTKQKEKIKRRLKIKYLLKRTDTRGTQTT